MSHFLEYEKSSVGNVFISWQHYNEVILKPFYNTYVTYNKLCLLQTDLLFVKLAA